jgi:hypothetical protein
VAAEDSAFGQPLLILECPKAMVAYSEVETASEAKRVLCETVALAALSTKSRSVNHAVMSSYCLLEDALLQRNLDLLELRHPPNALMDRVVSCIEQARDEKSVKAEEEALVLCRLCYLEKGALLKQLWRVLIETPLQIESPQPALDLLWGLCAKCTQYASLSARFLVGLTKCDISTTLTHGVLLVDVLK